MLWECRWLKLDQSHTNSCVSMGCIKPCAHFKGIHWMMDMTTWGDHVPQWQWITCDLHAKSMQIKFAHPLVATVSCGWQLSFQTTVSAALYIVLCSRCCRFENAEFARDWTIKTKWGENTSTPKYCASSILTFEGRHVSRSAGAGNKKKRRLHANINHKSECALRCTNGTPEAVQ